MIIPTHKATIEESNNNLKRSLDLVLVEDLQDKSQIYVEEQKQIIDAYYEKSSMI